MNIQMKKKFGDPPTPLKKADFGCLKAKMGCFSEKGLCYSFEILQGLLGNKNMKIPMKKISGTPFTPLKKPILGGKGRNGLLSNKNIWNPMKKLFGDTGGSPKYLFHWNLHIFLS